MIHDLAEPHNDALDKKEGSGLNGPRATGWDEPRRTGTLVVVGRRGKRNITGAVCGLSTQSRRERCRVVGAKTIRRSDDRSATSAQKCDQNVVKDSQALPPPFVPLSPIMPRRKALLPERKIPGEGTLPRTSGKVTTLSHAASLGVDSSWRRRSGVHWRTSHQRTPSGHGTPSS
jgi:hypothetical protein